MVNSIFMNIRWFWALAIVGLFSMQAEGAWELNFSRPAQALPNGASFSEREAGQAGRAVRIQSVSFSVKQCRLEVINNEPKRESLEPAFKAAGCFAGVNGGYFHDSFVPVGLMISNARQVHPFERAKLLSGVLVIRGKQAALIRSSEFKPSDQITGALQAGPFLLDRGVPAAGLNGEKVARRTVIACDDEGRWAILLFSHVSLADTAALLGSSTIFPDMHFKRALNLDGGSSSGLWANVTPKPFYLRGFTTVRNFVGVRAQ